MKDKKSFLLKPRDYPSVLYPIKEKLNTHFLNNKISTYARR